MFIPGPSRQSTLFALISSPSIEKSSLTSSLLKVEAISVPFGRLKAFVPVSRRIPEGPSEQQPQGTPIFFSLSLTPPKAAAVPGVTFGEHIPSPRTRTFRSSSVSCAMKSSRLHLPFLTSKKLKPLSPVTGISFGRSSSLRCFSSTFESGTFSNEALPSRFTVLSNSMTGASA